MIDIIDARCTVITMKMFVTLLTCASH